MITDYEIHPAADVFPLLADKELDDLAADIKSNGLHNPIILYEDKILDGRNRYLACRRAGVMPTFDYYRGSGSPLAWVVSQNLHRRHLDASQRAMVAAALVPMFEAEAKERQRQGARRKVPASLPEAGEAREKAAAVVNVSPRLVSDAKKVLELAPPEVVEAVKAGTVKVSAAVKAIPTQPTRPAITRHRPRRSGSASRIPASIPKWARKSIPEFAAFISARFTSTDRIRLGRTLIGREDGESAA